MSLLEHAPRFRAADAAAIGRRRYGFEARAEALPSERDQNFLLTPDSGERRVLKIANSLERRDLLEAQNAAMACLADTGLCSAVIPDRDGESIVTVRSGDGTEHFVRLVSYLEGVPLGEVKRHSDELLASLGRAVAVVNSGLRSFDHPAIHREFHWDLARALDTVREHRSLVSDAALGERIDFLSARYERETLPLSGDLRRSAIHNDANDFNVLAGGGTDLYTCNQSVVGLLDFGDIVYSHAVNDLAIAAAYAVLDKPDILGAAAQVVGGYHAVQPLEDVELAALFDLICMRLCVSACVAARQTAQRPDDSYLSISQAPVRRALDELGGIHSRLARCVFREACGLEPDPVAVSFGAWLKENRSGLAPLVDAGLDQALPVDLSVGSPLVSSDPGENGGAALAERLRAYLDDYPALGIGGYDEARALEPGRCAGTEGAVHFGVDLTAPAGTAVTAPLEGVVRAVGAAIGTGPSIILQHNAGEGLSFYTIYRRLSPGSLSGLSAGQPVAKGGRLGAIGSPAENGGSWPHLHFQIALDLLDHEIDFPSTAPASRRSVWRSLSPDPQPMLRCPVVRSPERRTAASILEERRRRIGRNLSVSYRRPLQIVRGWMQRLYDETGRGYLDAYNNVAHVGHSHPRVVDAMRRQIGILNTNTRYLQDQLVEYAARLTAHFPAPLGVCFFVNSGSEANELALRLARTHTGQKDLIVLDAAYHGHTNTLIDISPYKHDGPGGSGPPSWVHKTAIPDTFRGVYRRGDDRAGWKYAQEIGEVIERVRERGRGICGYIAETCPSVGGQILLPDGYLPEAYRLVREGGGLCIADEVQTGFGRMGTDFWAFEAHGVVPDIVVLGKPMGNGFPLGAVVTTPGIAQSFDNGMEFFSTFGGSTLSCAVGRAVLEVVEDEHLQEHALKVGRRLIDRLRTLAGRYPVVGDVRGSGLFAGVELVRDIETLEPAPDEASFVANRFRDHGILLGTDGPFHNVVKIRGPMPFSESDADMLAGVFESILEEDFAAV